MVGAVALSDIVLLVKYSSPRIDHDRCDVAVTRIHVEEGGGWVADVIISVPYAPEAQIS